MAPRVLDRVRRICLAQPDAHEQLAWGAPTFRVKGKLFAMYAHPATHTGAGRPGLWLHASKANQVLMVADRPHRFFVPPYVGVGGWVGVWLDGDVDWDDVRELARDAWRRVAPRTLVAQVEGADAAVAPTGIAAHQGKAKATATSRATSRVKTRATPKHTTKPKATSASPGRARTPTRRRP